MNTNEQAVVVAPDALASGMEDIRGLKPLAEVPGLGWWPWVLAGLAVVVLLVLAYLWRRSRRRIAPPPLPVYQAHLVARQQLEQALAFLSDPRLFCIRVSDAVRIYLELRFDFHAAEQTTEEFLTELQGSDQLTPDQKESLGEFLQQCDLVKFARHEPTETDLRALHDSACRLVYETQMEPLEPAGSPATT